MLTSWNLNKNLKQTKNNDEQDNNISAIRGILSLPPCTDSHALKNGYSAILVSAGQVIWKGRIFAEKAEEEPRLTGWKSHWGASSPPVLSILKQWDWKGREERPWAIQALALSQPQSSSLEASHAIPSLLEAWHCEAGHGERK